MNRFSIIVPLLDDRRMFDDSLASVLRYRPSSSQVIVVHDGTYDDPYGLGGEVDLVSTSSRADLVRLFNCALPETTGDYVALIRPGVELASGWNESVELKFKDPNTASVVPILVTPARQQTIVAAGITHGFGFRRRLVGAKSKIAPRTIRQTAPLGPTSWAAFYRRSALEQIGTCAERLDAHYLDVDIALSLRTIGYACDFCPDCVLEVERSALIERELTLPHGRSSQRAYRRHAARSGSTSSWFQATCAFTQELLLSAFQPGRLHHALGRLGAWTTAGLDRDYADHLAQLAHAHRQRAESGLGIREPGINSSPSRRAA